MKRGRHVARPNILQQIACADSISTTRSISRRESSIPSPMSFTKAFILFLSFVLSTYALATPHVPRGLHRALAARLPVDPLASADPTAPVRKRQNKRCRPRSSTVILSSAGQSTKVLVPSAVTTHKASATASSHEVLLTTTLGISTSKEAEPSMTTQKPPPSSIKEAEPPVTTKKPSPTPSPTKEAEPPVTTKKPSPTPSPTKEAEPPVTTKKPSPPPSSNLPSFMVGTQKGEGTFYSSMSLSSLFCYSCSFVPTAGLGACGVTNKDTDHIAAVSYLLFDAYP